MIGAIMRAQALSTLRDRGALIMTFVLPPLLFLLFAAIFTGVGGETAHVKVAAALTSDAEAAEKLLAALAKAPDIELHRMPEAEVERKVTGGDDDVGLIVREDPSTATPRPPLLILADPGRSVAAAVLMSRLQNLMTEELPDMAMRRVAAQMQVLTGPFSDEQNARLDASVARARELVAQGGAQFIERREVAALSGHPAVSYYAGAIAMLFLLFAAVQGAASLVDERRSGVFDRLVMSQGGLSALILGKMAFLVLQGLALCEVLLAVAQVAYGVPASAHPLEVAVVALFAAGAAAGVALPLAAGSRTRHQAQTLSTFVVLLLSAVGGSMVPRFLMPEWLRRAGDLTPTAWGIEAFQGVLWRGDGLGALLPSLGVLLIFAVAGGALAVLLVRRAVRLG